MGLSSSSPAAGSLITKASNISGAMAAKRLDGLSSTSSAACTYVRMYVCVYVYVCMCMCICICVYMCMCVCVYENNLFGWPLTLSSEEFVEVQVAPKPVTGMELITCKGGPKPVTHTSCVVRLPSRWQRQVAAVAAVAASSLPPATAAVVALGLPMTSGGG